jgi:hypothetical protein
MSDSREALAEWLRIQFVAEQEAGFPFLRRVPDTQVILFLDQFAELDRQRQADLISILVEWSSFNLLRIPLPVPVYERFAKATAFPGRATGLRYTGVNLLAGLAKDHGHVGLPGFFKSQGITGLALEPPPGFLVDPTEIVAVKIPTLRRMVATEFATLFSPHVSDIGSETWQYEGLLDGCQLKVRIRYSGRMGRPQLAYNAEVRGNGRAIVSPVLGYESIHGVGFGRWDYLTSENAERSVALLGELVQWLARLPQRLTPA